MSTKNAKLRKLNNVVVLTIENGETTIYTDLDINLLVVDRDNNDEITEGDTFLLTALPPDLWGAALEFLEIEENENS